MSKKLILCLAFFAGCLSYAAAQAELHFEKTTFDFGEFMEKDVQTAVFTFTNTGNEPLVYVCIQAKEGSLEQYTMTDGVVE